MCTLVFPILFQNNTVKLFAPVSFASFATKECLVVVVSFVSLFLSFFFCFIFIQRIHDRDFEKAFARDLMIIICMSR